LLRHFGFSIGSGIVPLLAARRNNGHCPDELTSGDQRTMTLFAKPIATW
jgi:hypothetical protein